MARISIHGCRIEDDNNNATTMRLLATVMSAGRVRFDTGGPGKVYRAPSV
jgi:hypothetical protein